MKKLFGIFGTSDYFRWVFTVLLVILVWYEDISFFLKGVLTLLMFGIEGNYLHSFLVEARVKMLQRLMEKWTEFKQHT